MKHNIRLKVNGEAREMAVDSSRTLLDVLQEDFRLARTKEGCGIGECGSCTVAIDRKLVNACLVLAVDADETDIVTMEQMGTEPRFTSMMEAFMHPDQEVWRAREGSSRPGDGAAAPGMTTSTSVFTFCHLCPANCSMKAVVEDDKVVDLEPDVESGFYSEQCVLKKGRFTIPEVLVHKDRLLYPQKRVGARGEGKWQRISWDEALDTIASKFTELKNKFGPQSVSFGLGEPKGMEFAYGQRLASSFGTPSVVTPGWFCGVPKSMAATYTYGRSTVSDGGGDKLPALIVSWGSNMTHTSGGLKRENLERILESGGKLIAIDPQPTYVARLADLWIRIKPGSDGALAAGVLKLIIEEKLYDQDIVNNWTVGFDKLREEVAQFSLDDVERLTWVPRRQIEEFARTYAQTKPSALQAGNALCQHVNSFQTARAIAILRSICGNLNVPGGDIFLTLPPFTRPGKFYLLSKYPRKTELLLGDKFKLAQMSTAMPSHVWSKAILEEEPYPIKAAFFILTNPLVSYPNSEETYRALMKLEFSVISELFLTPTAALADIVLPVAWGMEHDELGYWPAWYGQIRANPKLVNPPGECWSDGKIIIELAKRLGLGKDFWEDEHQALDEMLEPSGMTYEKFKEKRALMPEKEYRRHDYRTPSRKIEIYSDRIAKLGYEPIPRWQELSKIREQSEEYPLMLTNGKEEAYVVSGYKHVASLRLMRPDPLVQMHPETAERYGLQEGKWIYIETKMGRVKQRLSLNPKIDPRVVVAALGWWFPEKAGEGYGWRDSNINMLTSCGPDYDPATGTVSMRGISCRVRQA
jgi:anaerobic selenocysteine-containing dehydrogenase